MTQVSKNDINMFVKMDRMKQILYVVFGFALMGLFLSKYQLVDTEQNSFIKPEIGIVSFTEVAPQVDDKTKNPDDMKAWFTRKETIIVSVLGSLVLLAILISVCNCLKC